MANDTLALNWYLVSILHNDHNGLSTYNITAAYFLSQLSLTWQRVFTVEHSHLHRPYPSSTTDSAPSHQFSRGHFVQ